MPSPDGNVHHTYFQLSLSGETLTGKVFGRYPGGNPLNGTYTAGHLHFVTSPPPAVAGSPIATGSTAASTTYDGTYTDGKLKVAWHRWEGQIVTGTAIRSTKEAATPQPRFHYRRHTIFLTMAWSELLPWAGTVGTSSPAESLMPTFAPWPMQ